MVFGVGVICLWCDCFRHVLWIVLLLMDLCLVGLIVVLIDVHPWVSCLLISVVCFLCLRLCCSCFM